MALARKIIAYTEYMVGASHPTLSDTLSRAFLIDHDQYGAHTKISYSDALTNKDGSTLTTGMVVIQDTANASAYKRTTTANALNKVFVVQDTIVNNGTGHIADFGIVVDLMVQGNVAIGDFLGTSTTSGRAASQGATAAAGAFAVAHTAYSGGAAGTVKAFLLGITMASSLETGTWSDVSGSRAINTVYQNTSGRKRRVKVQGTRSGVPGTALSAYGFVDTANPPTTQIDRISIGDTPTVIAHEGTINLEVPNGSYYKVTDQTLGGVSSFTISGWREMDE